MNDFWNNEPIFTFHALKNTACSNYITDYPLTNYAFTADNFPPILFRRIVLSNSISYEYFLTKHRTMKITLSKQIGLFSMLVLFFNLAYTQPQNQLLLPYLLQRSLAAGTTGNNDVISFIPLQANLQNYTEKYLNKNAESLNEIRQRNTSTFTTVKKILVKRGIPEELIYLAIIESELKNGATSPVGAVGIWQLMPETARTFGLKVNGKTDERRHISQSSVAAANYLTSLYKQFDDWILVVAAYNCGAGTVNKAIKQSGSREFWKLQRFLPAESRNHVKHFIATHFYYENAGSMVTLTKKERINYLASLNEITLKKDESIPGSLPISSKQPLPDVLVLREEDGWKSECRNQ